jgi:DNA-binding MarR family transcriptional regulator
MAELPDDVDRFIMRHVDTLEQLEILLLLRAHRSRSFSAREVTAELRLGAGSASERLADLEARGFLAAQGDPPLYAYSPDSAETERVINAVATCYSERKVSVITRIFTPRSDVLRSFADSFKLRRK